MNIQETQQAYEAWMQANPDFDEELLEKDEDGQYLDEDIKFSYQSFEAGTIAQEYISLNEIRAKQHEINELNNEHKGQLEYLKRERVFLQKKYSECSSEIDELKAKLEAKLEAAQVKDGFVLVPKELPESIAEAMALNRVEKPIHETDPIWIKISEGAYKSQLQRKKWEFWRDYKAMIEAAQGEEE